MNRIINVNNCFSNSWGAYLSTGPVSLDNLSEDDKGRGVVYISPHKDKKEFGYITSWNTWGVFVRFNSGCGSAACSPDLLQFVEKEETK